MNEYIQVRCNSTAKHRKQMSQKIVPIWSRTATADRRSMYPLLVRLQIVCLICCYYFSIGMVQVFAEEFRGITNDGNQQQQQRQQQQQQQGKSPYQNEPSYGEQAWIFEAINILGAWNAGYTGEDVRVRINDDNWEWNHTEWKIKDWSTPNEWKDGDWDRVIHDNENAETDYSCGDLNNELGDGPDTDKRKIKKKKNDDYDGLNHGAAITSILGADGNNGFCGTGIAPNTRLSFCKFDLKSTDPHVLMYKILSQELGASLNSFDVSMNAFAYEGCSSEPRGDIVGLYRKKENTTTTAETEIETETKLDDESNIGRSLQQIEIKKCPFLKFYNDEQNPGDDPCLVCTKSDFGVFDVVSNQRDNIFQAASSATASKTAGDGGIAGVSKACATSVRAYCLRNFRQDEALCTEWIEVINDGNICRFKSNVGEENAYSLEEGAKEGRFERGVTFIFPAGDSYGNGDNLNFQAYPKSRFVMTVGAVKMKEFPKGKNKKKTIQKPVHSTYSTSGSSIFVVAPGGDYDSPHQHVGAGGLEGYANSCVNIGYGTSFAASVVGGVVALMLGANPLLTYRDIRAIIAETSKPVEILDSENINNDATFEINAAGFGYSELYGFGLIDATAAVNEAATWLDKGRTYTIPREELGITLRSGVVNLDIDDDSFSTTTSTIMLKDFHNNGGVVESVSVYLKLRYFNRGNLRITLTSPSGTTSLLSPGGRHEFGQLECDEWWEFLTLRSWGENPYGKWKLSITDTKSGSGEFVCMDRPTFEVPRSAFNYIMTCENYESQGLCVDGRINDEILILENKGMNKTLFKTRYGKCDDMLAEDACCVCGGGIRPDDDEVLYNQLEEWKIVLGDGTPTLGTKLLSNYDPFLPTVSKYEFIRCRYQTLYGERLECCNGLEDVCGLRVNEYLFATLHNGMSHFDNGSYVSINKEFEVERGLEAGYRAFKLDICNCNGKLEFCVAGMCSEFGRRVITDLMFYFREFFERNPSEIAIIFFEIRSDVDQYVHLPDFWVEMLQVMRLDEMIYVHDAPNKTHAPNSTTPWPTLRELIRDNKRLIMFHHNGPNCTETPLDCPSKLHYYYDWVSDNFEREFMEPDEIENRADACILDRQNMTDYTNTFVGLRNFVTPANFREIGKVNAIRDADRLNKYYAAEDYVQSCAEILERDINFIMDDWWGVGSVLRMTQDYNMARALGETWIPPTPSPTETFETEAPTGIPTWYPTWSLATPAPTASNQPSVVPTGNPTGPYDPCPGHKNDCKSCKEKMDECLWCASTSNCYNREIFSNIFDLDDEILPCAGEDILDSFDTTCEARRPLPSVFDDDLVMLRDDNETIAVEADDDDYTIEVIDSESPTDPPSVPPPTLPPILVPLSPPTAVEGTQNFFTNLFGGGKTSGASYSWTVVLCCSMTVSSALLLLRDV